MSVFGLGYAIGDFSDHGDWRAKINNSTPVRPTNTNILSAPNDSGYFTYTIRADDKAWLLEYALIDDGMQDFIRWLESIHTGCAESVLLMNQEGPVDLVYASCDYMTDDMRLVLISDAERLYDSHHQRYVENDDFNKRVKELGGTQVVFDIIINKLDFVEVMYVLTHMMAEKKDVPMYHSSLIEAALDERPEKHENMFFKVS